MLTIEKNIPYSPDPTKVTPKYHGAVGTYIATRKWPWLQMQPGDSFTVSTQAEMRSARGSFYQHSKTRYSKIPPSWFVATKKISNVYRLWLFDRENPETPVDKTP
jgi:hypothetical protein